MTKLLENIFRSVNIALVNELAILSDRMGIDIWEVVDAAATKPYGFMRFEPGPGMGGHCLPVDPFYLTWRAREFHMSTEFIELAGKINQQMPYHCVERIERALNDVPSRSRARRSRSSASATRAASATSASPPRCGSWRCWPSAAAMLRYHDPYVPVSARRSGCTASRWRRPPPTPTPSCSSPPTPASTISAIAQAAPAVRRPPRGHPGDATDNLVRL